MPLPRQHVIVYDSRPIRDRDGWIIRNKVLQPCGCWSGEVWRKAAPPGEIGPAYDGWQPQSVGCTIHSAAFAVEQLQFAARMNGVASLANIGDGAKRLLVDAANVLARAAALDEELFALTGEPPPTISNQFKAVASRMGLPTGASRGAAAAGAREIARQQIQEARARAELELASPPIDDPEESR